MSMPPPDNIIKIEPGVDLPFLRAELCSESRAAEIFCSEDGGRYARFAPGLGWLIWDGMRWARDDSDKILSLAMCVAEEYRRRAMLYERARCPKELSGWLLAFARRMNSTQGMRAFLAQARAPLRESVDAFDAAPLKINFRNGTLDLESFVKRGDEFDLYSHASADLLTKVIPNNYVPNAPAPRWNAFLERILPDPETRAFFKRAVGYSLTGLTREQVFFLLHGGGANGKSTALNVLQKLIGPDYSMQANPQSFMADDSTSVRSDLAFMRGARFVSAIETSDGRRLDESLIKLVTGGDAIRTRHLYQDEFEYRPTLKLWLCSNHLPRIRGTDHAIWRRVRLIPFTVRIPDDEQDKGLDESLLREAEGILAWAVDGAIEYLRQGGLNAPIAVLAATDAYRADEDDIGDFIESSCVVGPNVWCQASVLHAEFQKITGSKISAKAFCRSMKERGFDSIKRDGVMTWIGIGLQHGNIHRED